MVENGYEVQRVLDGSSVALCLDTGHLLTGGTDPAELAPQVPGRIAHASAGWVRAEALAGFVANVGIALGSSRTVDATSRLP